MDKILIVGKNHEEINASREVKRIRQTLTPVNGRVGIHAIDDPEARDIIAELRRHNPTVLHLISHGTVDEITGLPFFDVADADGGVKEIGLADLRDHLRRRSEDETTRRLKCIVLNACKVGQWAHNFRDVADVVIGADGMLPEVTAQEFSMLFYAKLAEGCSVQQAYGESVDTLRTERYRGVEQFMLVQTHSGIAAQTYIGRPEAVERSAARAGERSKYDVYMLFAKADCGPGYRMANRLESLGVSSFRDCTQARGAADGRNWILEVQQAMGESECGAVLLSKTTMDDVVAREQYSALLLDAWSKGKRMIPVIINDGVVDDDIPMLIRPRIGADFRGRGTRETYMEELERLRRGILDEPPPKPPLDDVWP